MSDDKQGVLYIGIDLGTSRTSVAASNGVRETVWSYVGYPKDVVSRKLLKKDKLFGKEAAKALKVVECAPDGQDNQVDLCRSKGLEGFPSWEINGAIDSGVKPLDKLADLSGYKGSREF